MRGNRLFALLHAFNAVLSMAFTLGQTLVLARRLDGAAFAEAIAVVAVGLYLLPVNQAVARTNFILLRENHVLGRDDRGVPEAGASFHASQLVMLVVSLTAPLLIAPGAGPGHYVALAAFALFCTFSNLWFFEIQSSLLATENALVFEWTTLARRAANFGALLWFYFKPDFGLFCLVLAVQTVAFQLFVVARTGRGNAMFRWPRDVRALKVRDQLGRLWVSAETTFAEWFSLNAPYAVFTARFGLGPSLIVLDTGMKVLRVALTVVRNLGEIALPRVSAALLRGEVVRARTDIAIVVGLGGAASLVLAAALALQGPLVFRILLGPTHAVPAAAGAPFALAVVAGIGFQAGSLLVGYVGRVREMRLFSRAAIACAAAGALYVLFGQPTLVQALWGFAVALAGAGLAGAFALVRTLAPNPIVAPGAVIEEPSGC